jgi:hypothetical protein
MVAGSSCKYWGDLSEIFLTFDPPLTIGASTISDTISNFIAIFLVQITFIKKNLEKTPNMCSDAVLMSIEHLFV